MAGIMQTLQNGIEVPTNSDPYNLTDDLSGAFTDANVVIPVASLAVRDALVKRGGLPVARLDLGGLVEVWDADMGAWTRGIQHAEFTSFIPVEADIMYGTGPLTRDTAKSRYGDAITSPAPDKLFLPGPAIYSIQARMALSTNAVGSTYAVITDDGGTFEYTSADVLPGNKVASLSMPNLYVPTSQNIRLRYFTQTPGLPNLATRVRVTRIG